MRSNRCRYLKEQLFLFCFTANICGWLHDASEVLGIVDEKAYFTRAIASAVRTDILWLQVYAQPVHGWRWRNKFRQNGYLVITSVCTRNTELICFLRISSERISCDYKCMHVLLWRLCMADWRQNGYLVITSVCTINACGFDSCHPSFVRTDILWLQVYAPNQWAYH